LRDFWKKRLLKSIDKCQKGVYNEAQTKTEVKDNFNSNDHDNDYSDYGGGHCRFLGSGCHHRFNRFSRYEGAIAGYGEGELCGIQQKSHCGYSPLAHSFHYDCGDESYSNHLKEGDY
jgi:hypothetical protein